MKLSLQNQSDKLTNKKQKIRIGTRTSNLALAQVAEVKNYLQVSGQVSGFDCEFEIVPINTSGDKIQDRNLAQIGGKGLFIKELEESLLSQKIDFAVHSAKDVPPVIHSQTEISAFTKRIDDRDCMISSQYRNIEELPQNAVIGTSSARRKAFLLRMRPDLQIIDFRGNIDTRLDKVFARKVDAAILAISGITRINKQSLVSSNIEISKMLPAGGQGSLALQILKNNHEISDLIACLNHSITKICIKTERAFLRELGASCFTPVGVNARIENNELVLRTAIISYDGKEIYETSSSCDPNLEAGIALGVAAAKRTINSAQELLSKITHF